MTTDEIGGHTVSTLALNTGATQGWVCISLLFMPYTHNCNLLCEVTNYWLHFKQKIDFILQKNTDLAEHCCSMSTKPRSWLFIVKRKRHTPSITTMKLKGWTFHSTSRILGKSKTEKHFLTAVMTPSVHWLVPYKLAFILQVCLQVVIKSPHKRKGKPLFPHGNCRRLQLKFQCITQGSKMTNEGAGVQCWS